MMSILLMASCSIEDIDKDIFNRFEKSNSSTRGCPTDSVDVDYTFIQQFPEEPLTVIIEHEGHEYHIGKIRTEGSNLMIDDLDDIVNFTEENSGDKNVKLISYKNIKIRFEATDDVNECSNLKVVDVEHTVNGLDKTYMYFELSVKFVQDVTVKHYETSEDVSLKIEYNVKFGGQQEVTLDKVAYSPHIRVAAGNFNLVTGSYWSVTRDRYYSNGEVLTDYFTDYGKGAPVASSILPAAGLGTFGPKHFRSKSEDGEDWYRCKMIDETKPGAYNDLEDVEIREVHYFEGNGAMGTTGKDELIPDTTPYENFSISKTYEVPDHLDASEAIDISDKPYPKTSMKLKTGFYMHQTELKYNGAEINMCVGEFGEDDSGYVLCNHSVMIGYYDSFMIIDGRFIHFDTSLKNFTASHKTEDYISPEGYRGVRSTVDIRFVNIGRNYHVVNEINAYEVPE